MIRQRGALTVGLADLADAALVGRGDVAAGSAWDDAAQALHAMLCEPERTWLKLTIDSDTVVFVDSRLRAFERSIDVTLPSAPRRIDCQVTPVPYDAHPPFAPPGENLGGLLWIAGLNAFDGRPAPWLGTGDRYRLRRWPNFTTLAHSVDQLRLTATIGSRLHSVDEMAAAADIDRPVAQALINAFSLMGILHSAPPLAGPATLPIAAAASGSGLFARLRRRLGL